MSKSQINQFLGVFNNSLNSFDDNNQYSEPLNEILHILKDNVSPEVVRVDKIQIHESIEYSEAKPRRVFTIDDIVQDIYKKNEDAYQSFWNQYLKSNFDIDLIRKTPSNTERN